MRHSVSLLALASVGVVSAELLNRNFTINLLTQVPDMSVSLPDSPEQIPMHYNNASIKHVYDNVLYSVVGSLTFTETGKSQAYHMDNDQWSVTIDLTLVNAENESTTHLDLAISKEEPKGTEMRFDHLTKALEGVDVRNDQRDKVDKQLDKPAE